MCKRRSLQRLLLMRNLHEPEHSCSQVSLSKPSSNPVLATFYALHLAFKV